MEEDDDDNEQDVAHFDHILNAEAGDEAGAATTDRPYLPLLDACGYVRQRARQSHTAVISYKRFKEDSEQWDYDRVTLMLYMPWRDERGQVEVESTTQKLASEPTRTIVIANRSRFESLCAQPFADMARTLDREIREHMDRMNSEEAHEMECAHNYLLRDTANQLNQAGGTGADDGETRRPNGGEQTAEQVVQECERLEQEFGFQMRFDDPRPDDQRVRNAAYRPDDDDEHQRMDRLRGVARARLSDEEYRDLMRSLNPRQFAYMTNLLKGLVPNPGGLERREQNFHFITGGGGVGKSVLISAIYETLQRLGFRV